MVLRLMVAWENDDAAMHAMLALTGRCFSARLAWDVGVKLKHGLLFDHDPSDPRIGYGEHQKQAHDGACAEVQVSERRTCVNSSVSGTGLAR